MILNQLIDNITESRCWDTQRRPSCHGDQIEQIIVKHVSQVATYAALLAAGKT